MRTKRILHPQLTHAIATLGHTDIILVTDAGFPIPVNANRIDLGFYEGMIDVLDILKVLRQEIFVEEVHFAPEVKTEYPELYKDVQQIYTGSGADFFAKTHQELCSEIAPKAKFIIRSGSFKPWANFALVASTDPFAWFTKESGVSPLSAYTSRREKIEKNIVPDFY